VEQGFIATNFLLFVPRRLKTTLIFFLIFLSYFFQKVLQSVTTSSSLFLIPLWIPIKIWAALVSFPHVKRLIVREEMITVTNVLAVAWSPWNWQLVPVVGIRK
jgi:hypothetical protein